MPNVPPRVLRALCIHDLACVGRCSLSVAAPVLSAQGIQACLLPAALLSTHTGGFGTPACAPQTAFCHDALDHFSQLGISFDAIYSGYLADADQTELVRRAFAQSPAAYKLVDPCMADAGKLYSSVTPALCDAMTALCEQADLLTPNLTESAILLGLAPCCDTLDDAQLQARAALLAKRFPTVQHIAITSVRRADGRFGNVFLSPTDFTGAQFMPFAHTSAHFPGTGDLFASVLLGSMLRGLPPQEGVRRAAAFTARAVCATQDAATPPQYGLQFEPLLSSLAP